MDKRSLFFVFSLTITLLVVNMFFNYNQDQQSQDWQQQQEAKVEKQKQQLEADVAQRTAKLEQLPIVMIYADQQGEKYLTTGVLTENAVLTLSWDNEIPNTVFIKKPDQESGLTKAIITSEIKTSNTPAIYRTEVNAKLSSAKLPTAGSFDLQLLVPKSSATGEAEVSLGEFVDNKLKIPLATPTSAAGRPMTVV